MLGTLQLQADIWLVVKNTFFTNMDCKQLHCWTARFIQQVTEVKGSLQTTPQYLQHNSTQGWQGLDSFHLMWIFIAWSGEQSACGDFA